MRLAARDFCLDGRTLMFIAWVDRDDHRIRVEHQLRLIRVL
jgi:hypothetical protein